VLQLLLLTLLVLLPPLLLPPLLLLLPLVLLLWPLPLLQPVVLLSTVTDSCRVAKPTAYSLQHHKNTSQQQTHIMQRPKHCTAELRFAWRKVHLQLHLLPSLTITMRQHKSAHTTLHTPPLHIATLAYGHLWAQPHRCTHPCT
jgi:hypothetical protein